MRTLFLLTLFFFLSAPARACSCVYTDNFCEYLADYQVWDAGENLVVVARVTLTEFRQPQPGFPLFDFRIEDILSGEYEQPFVSLLGQDGANCNAGGGDLEPGDELILFFSKRGYFSARGYQDVPNDYPIYDFIGCGVSYLHVSGLAVTGSVTSTVNRTGLNSLIGLLRECGPLVASIPVAPALKIYPNPTRNWVNVELEDPETRVEAVHLYDIHNRQINNTFNWPRIADAPTLGRRVRVADLPPGVYVLVVRTDRGDVSQRVSVTE